MKDRTHLLSEAFSTPEEIHAFVHGLFKGLFELTPDAEVPDSVMELHYFRAGYILGWAIDYRLGITEHE